MSFTVFRWCLEPATLTRVDSRFFEILGAISGAELCHGRHVQTPSAPKYRTPYYNTDPKRKKPHQPKPVGTIDMVRSTANPQQPNQ